MAWHHSLKRHAKGTMTKIVERHPLVSAGLAVLGVAVIGKKLITPTTVVAPTPAPPV